LHICHNSISLSDIFSRYFRSSPLLHAVHQSVMRAILGAPVICERFELGRLRLKDRPHGAAGIRAAKTLLGEMIGVTIPA